jgi:hypothetical protein
MKRPFYRDSPFSILTCVSLDQSAVRVVDPALVRDLRTQLRGAVLQPDAAGYAEAGTAQLGVLDPPEAADAVRQHAVLVEETMRPYTTGAVVPNFLGDHDVGPERTCAAYSAEHYGRLVTLKDAYAPRNLFRFNHNIPRSAA